MKTREEIILEAVVGMTRREWMKIVHYINREFDEASRQVEFTQRNEEGVKTMIDLEES